MNKQQWPSWGPDPHNPASGKQRPAFSRAALRDYIETTIIGKLRFDADAGGHISWNNAGNITFHSMDLTDEQERALLNSWRSD